MSDDPKQYTRWELRRVAAEFGQIDGCDAVRLLDALDVAEDALEHALETNIGRAARYVAALEAIRKWAPR